MHKKRYAILLCAFLLILALFFMMPNKSKSFEISESSGNANFELLESSGDANIDVDIVFYPFSIGISTISMESFALLDDTVKPIKQEVTTGYSSIVNTEVLQKLVVFLSVSSIDEVEDKLGQYCSYKNFDGTELLVFYNWYSSPYALNIVTIRDDNINIITEEFQEIDLFPIAIKQCENGALLLLRDGLNFEVRKIDTVQNTMQSSSFKIEDTSNCYYYFVDMVFSNNQLYLMTNKLDQENDDNKDLGSYLFTYDISTDILDSQKTSDSEIGFFSGDDEMLCYGNLSPENMLTISRIDLLTKNEYKQELMCVDDVEWVIGNSALYSNSQLYINLSVKKEEDNQGVLYRFDLNHSGILNRYLYTYNGSLFVRYFEKDTAYQHNAKYATGY